MQTEAALYSEDCYSSILSKLVWVGSWLFHIRQTIRRQFELFDDSEFLPTYVAMTVTI